MDDDDLSDLGLTVTHRRRDPEAGRRLTTDPLTRAYLDAGVRLLELELLNGGAEDDAWDHPLSTLTRRALVEEIVRGGYRGKTSPGDGSFRDRWPKQANYFADLVRYTMRDEFWSDELELADKSTQPLSTQSRLSSIVHAVAYRDTRLVSDGSAALRFHLLATAMANKYASVLTALTSAYIAVTARWQPPMRQFSPLMRSRYARISRSKN
jgi:hypothetical protein